MKINISEMIERERKGDKAAEQIEYFLIHLITHFDKQVRNLAPENTVDVEVKINEKEVDILEFIEYIFSQFDRQVAEKVTENTNEIFDNMQVEFRNMMAQYMHKNGLISTQEYSDKIWSS